MPAMTRLVFDHLTLWITAAASEHSHDLVPYIEERTGASRRAVLAALRKLQDAGWLTRSGTKARPVFAPGSIRQVARNYTLHGLQEDLPWQRDFAPHFALPKHVERMVQHGFTELVNNAADHSGGTSVTVSLRQTPTHVQLLVSDDGIGVFDRICTAFSLEDPGHAMLELSKGRLTSSPEAHTGRGLFFCSQLADVFDIHANNTAYQRRAWETAGWRKGKPLPRQGSSIYMAIALNTTRTLDGVMAAWSTAGDGIAFDQTVVQLRLLVSEGQALDSRAQGRRVGSRLAAFKRAEISFEGVTDVGHGFADELFRVFARANPQVNLVPTHTTPRIDALIKAAQAG